MVRFPNRTKQTGTYHTGSPNYVDVSSGSIFVGMVSFPAQATTDGWADGDLIGVLIESYSAYQVWLGRWDATNEYILEVAVEESAGTLTDAVTVTVTATPTTASLFRWHAEMSAAAALSF